MSERPLHACCCPPLVVASPRLCHRQRPHHHRRLCHRHCRHRNHPLPSPRLVGRNPTVANRCCRRTISPRRSTTMTMSVRTPLRTAMLMSMVKPNLILHHLRATLAVAVHCRQCRKTRSWNPPRPPRHPPPLQADLHCRHHFRHHRHHRQHHHLHHHHHQCPPPFTCTSVSGCAPPPRVTLRPHRCGGRSRSASGCECARCRPLRI